MKNVTTKFNQKLFRNTWMNEIVKKQTELLENYAISVLDKMAKSHDFLNQTYNLQDSFCWILYYNGEQRSYGFYGGKKATEDSLLHEWGTVNKQISVSGRTLAENFVTQYQPTIKNGWQIVWASVAPYGAYLEEGSTPSGNVFRVMTQEYDHIKQKLKKPCVVTFEINPLSY